MTHVILVTEPMPAHLSELESPRVSALLVSYNAISNGQISETILHEVYRAPINVSFEIVVVDNGSTDGSANILAAWSGRFSNFHVLCLAEKQAMVHAVTRASDIARGDFLFLLDIDEANQIASVDHLLGVLEGHECLHGLRGARPFSIRRLTSLLFNFVYHFGLGFRLRDIGHYHYLIPRRIFSRLRTSVIRHRLFAYPLAIEKEGIEVLQVQVESSPEGRSSYRFGRRMMRAARVIFECIRTKLIRV